MLDPDCDGQPVELLGKLFVEFAEGRGKEAALQGAAPPAVAAVDRGVHRCCAVAGGAAADRQNRQEMPLLHAGTTGRADKIRRCSNALWRRSRTWADMFN